MGAKRPQEALAWSELRAAEAKLKFRSAVFILEKENPRLELSPWRQR